jgi:phosphinothricin acetyltransferase
MSSYAIRAATLDDLPALTGIYNHYVAHTAISFDLHPLTADERRRWFDDHRAWGAHRLLVAVGANGACVGYASSSRWRAKAAYDTTVEASVYCDPSAVGRGYGTALYKVLFEELSRENVRTVVAGISLPNPASIALHMRFGFRPVGVFHAVGHKFDRYWDVEWFERQLDR